MSKDYKSFSGVASTRFKEMARHYGFTETSKAFYVKLENDIFYTYCLQKSVGNEFFYINYGIGIPYLWSSNKKLEPASVNSWFFGQRLENDYGQGFNCSTKDEITESAKIAQKLFEEQAIPWFNKFHSLEDAAKLFFTRDVVSESSIGTLKNECSSEALNYAFFHYHIKHLDKAKLWFLEAKRLYSLPIYFETKGNVTKIVHERPKGARRYIPDNATLEKIELIDNMLSNLN